MSDTCKNCRYFEEGYCFRFPPTITIHTCEIDEKDLGYWISPPDYVSRRPEVLCDDFCGEFRITEEVESDLKQLRLQILYGPRIVTKEEEAREDEQAKLQVKIMLAKAGYVEDKQDGTSDEEVKGDPAFFAADGMTFEDLEEKQDE